MNAAQTTGTRRWAGLWLAAAGLGASCGDAPPAPGPETPDSAMATRPPGTETSSGGAATVPPVPPPTEQRAGPPPPPDPAAEKLRAAAEAERLDAEAHVLLDAFRQRIWDLARDAPLARAEGEIAQTIDGRTGRYRFVFDGRPEGEKDRVVVTTVEEAPDLHGGAAAQAKRFAILAVLGPYHAVVPAIPPIPMRVDAPKEGLGRVLVVPPFKTPVSASLRFTAGGLVELRADWDLKSREVARHSWLDWKGRAVLVRTEWGPEAAKAGETASVAYEYGDRDGLPLLRRAVLAEGVHRCEATVSFTSIVRR